MTFDPPLGWGHALGDAIDGWRCKRLKEGDLALAWNPVFSISGDLPSREHIPSYSPQGRGRGERLNRTLQGRLINELRVAGITTVEAANAYLREQFIADYDAQFTFPPADPDPAFVALGTVDLDLILCQGEGGATRQAARPAHLRAAPRDRPPPSPR